jgi:hypothetical protein
MAEKNPKSVDQELTLTDDQIITERKLPRRSFLTAAGTLLAGGAAALVASTRVSAQDPAPVKPADDPDAKKAADPDAKKGSKKAKKEKKEKKAKKAGEAADPDSKPK